ncbi:hypothetical protein [Paractinoplanes rishiriensis]|uniref:GH26 domain-containing protein n=1 Tax=Paractinoplanes rishiriensis TaxID=1050105 RepID=A0A919JUI8_9ACTN|nr:hypothetical protein [Actinoplanes rishiriensis]GIE95461.1 hypothetical protein Ari01nite_29260 [Actinoplanes rishiriensis]
MWRSWLVTVVLVGVVIHAPDHAEATPSPQQAQPAATKHADAGTSEARPTAAAPPLTRYGVITSTQGSAVADDPASYIRLYNQNRARYGGPLGIRLFSAGRIPLPGDDSMAGALLTWAAAAHPDEPLTVSHKTRDDARLVKLLDWVHAKKRKLSVIYFHEVQDNWFKHRDQRATPAAYNETYRAYRRIIEAHPARDRVTLEKNLMWYWQHYNAKRQGGDWRLFVEANDPADLVSWDTYVFPGMPTAQRRYSTPDEFFRYARDVWRERSLPWAVGEIGSTVQDGVGAERDWDRDGKLFAAWVKRIATAAGNPAAIGAGYRGMPPARFVKWWAAPDRNNADQSLEQVPAAVTSYRELVRTAPVR